MAFWRFVQAAAVTVCLSGAALHAQSLPAPEGDVILTVTGAVTASNAEHGIELDLAMLEAMAAVEGVLAVEVLQAHGNNIRNNTNYYSAKN